MKKIELTKATEALAEYVKTIEGEPVVIVHRGFALAALVPLSNMDYESIELANNLQISLPFWRKRGPATSAQEEYRARR